MKTVLLTILLAFLTACGGSASPTRAIVVVTATADANSLTPIPGVTANNVTPNAVGTPGTEVQTPAAEGTTPPNTKPTNVKYVRALEDINIRKGPGTNFDIVGGVYKGQTAEVTGYQSADGKWWRVVCPVDNVESCWVSADPQLTEPAESPSAVPTPSADVTVEAYVRTLAGPLQAKNYDALRGMMADPFTFGYWQSEGANFSPTEATKRLQEQWLGPAAEVIVDVADKTNQTKLLNGTNPLTMWDPKVSIVKTVYVQGLAADGKAEGLLIISRGANNTPEWYGILFAQNGFAPTP